jgi:beta-1,4-mannosyltransferase
MLTPHPYLVKAREVVQVDRENRVRKRSQEQVLQVLMSPGPDDLTDNPSLLLLFSEVMRHGVKISPYSSKRNLLGRPDVIHIHFPEWLVGWKRPWIAPLEVVAVLGLLWLARRRGAALVWTGHDLEPHELSRPRLWRAYNRFFISQVDVLISFSDGATSLLVERYSQLAGVPTVVVPHGHYRDYYTAPPKAAILRKELNLDHRPVLLCFGLIRPYKNLPGIIRTWRQLPEPRPQLVIAGRPMDSEMAEVIKQEAGDSTDAHLLLRFIHDDEVPTIFEIADVVLMPYMARSALNSGVAHLAFSLSRPAVVNDTPANQNLRDVFGGEWVWLCDGTPEDALRTALVAAATTRPKTLDLDVINYKRLAAETLCAYSDATARHSKRSRPLKTHR